MPELPEVETIRRQMHKALAGRKIAGVDVVFGKKLNVPTAEFVKRVAGAKILGVRRRAKLLLTDLSNGETIATHLKMTGKYLLGAKRPAGKWTRVIFHLDKNQDLFFDDLRKFGFLKLVKTADVQKKVIDEAGYGPEPLEKSFTTEKFAECLLGRGPGTLKPRLLEQKCIAGVGNIYADESLWRAKLKPDRKVKSLKPAEIKALHDGVVSSMSESVKQRGTSADDFLDLYGKKGRNQTKLAVYGRDGEKCPRCGGEIKKRFYAGRGTHWCPKCQR